jgi:type IV fimbrial biogenesis protein FimT
MSEACKTMGMERKNGFTLIEMLITIVVVTILLAIGVPSFQEFIKNNRISGQSNNLVISIQLARNEAIKRGTGAVVCASTDQATCSGNDDWSTGWIVYSDVGQDGNLNLDANGDGVEDCLKDDCIVRTSNALTKNTLDGNGTNSIRFLPTGLTTNVAAVTLKLTGDDCNHNQVRDVTITRQGHTMVTRQNCP